MPNPADIPMPPTHLRNLVGPTDLKDFDNPTGAPVYPDLPPEQYEAVFDFACGCGRMARRLMQQTSRPARYEGIDVHKAMIEWSNEHLAPAAPGFRFYHHDVYSPMYAPGNSSQMTAPFPVEDSAFSLVIAHSIFTHLTEQQSEHYLREVARVLRPGGVAYTTWFFFDNESYPFLGRKLHTLYVDATNFALAVLYDRTWFLDAARRAGLGVRATTLPAVPGHQWAVWLERRTPGTVDQFPTGEDSAEWVCGATYKSIARVPVAAGVTGR